MEWDAAYDDALRAAWERCKPSRTLDPNAQDAVRKKWEEVANSEGLPRNCTAQAAFDRSVELGWKSYPVTTSGGQKVLGGGSSAARSHHPAAYHLSKAGSGAGGSGGSSSSSSSSSSAGAAAGSSAAAAPAAGSKRQEQPQAERRPMRYRVGTVEGMQHMCSGLSGGTLDEAAFVALYKAALSHYRL